MQVEPTRKFTVEERRLLEEYVLRHTGVRDQNVLSGLFDKQLTFLNDPCRFKAALCGRRAGKTHCITRALIDACLKHKDTTSAYITLSRLVAKRLVWRPLQKLSEDYGLNVKFNHTEMVAEFPNGSLLIVTGASDTSDIEKLRGDKYQLVVIDECASFPEYIEPLIEDVLLPALEDNAGDLLVIGTPGNVCAGYFYKITTEPDRHGFSLHKWTVLDNPKFPRWAGDPHWRDLADIWLDELKTRKGYNETHPGFLREWRGQWIASVDSLMYHIDDDNMISPKDIPTIKSGKLKYVIGMDLGWHDKTAFVVAGYDSIQQKVYEVYSVAHTGLTVSQTAAIADSLIETYDPERVRIDSAGEGKIVIESLAEEIGRRFDLPIEAAEKQRKAAFVHVCDSDLVAGNVLLRKDSQLAPQMQLLQWDAKHRREKENMACDLADAWLYAYRDCLAWAKEAPPKRVPKHGTAVWLERHMEEIERQEEERANADLELRELENW